MNTNTYSLNGEKLKNTVRLFLVFILLFLIISGIFIGIRYKVVKDKRETDFEMLKISESHLINLEKKLLQRKIQRIVSDTFLIKDFVESNFNTGNEASFEDQVKEYFKNFIENKLVYYQIRYLDENGMEVVRVDYKNGESKICPKENLQNKGNRYYFTETQKIGKNQAYISKLDLNIENGKIEVPLTPMIRVSTNVFDKDGNNKGIVIVNYFAEIIINDFENIGKGSYGNLYLLNKDSYWIKNLKDSSKDFAFMYEDKFDQKFSKLYPDVWSEVINGKSDFVSTDEDLFFIREISLFQEHGYFKYATSPDRIIANEKNFFIVSHIEKKITLHFLRKQLLLM